MNQRIYHGNISIANFTSALLSQFQRGNYRVQQFGEQDKSILQIGTREQTMSGGQTALSVILQKVEDGVAVQVGQQAWLGIAASLGTTAISVLRNPWSLVSRLDDLAQDIENLQMSDDVWRILDETAQSLGATQEFSERLRRLVCEYCDTANPVGEASCIACGAPLGSAQPITCKKCGFVVFRQETKCPNCGNPL
ncbi:MAG: zinc ribbon domain-containing protein [Anaerolineaceae bacterium]|nr:zinc ribbon domain-containing protein [Anaerolineaceae bacterium]